MNEVERMRKWTKSQQSVPPLIPPSGSTQAPRRRSVGLRRGSKVRRSADFEWSLPFIRNAWPHCWQQENVGLQTKNEDVQTTQFTMRLKTSCITSWQKISSKLRINYFFASKWDHITFTFSCFIVLSKRTDIIPVRLCVVVGASYCCNPLFGPADNQAKKGL